MEARAALSGMACGTPDTLANIQRGRAGGSTPRLGGRPALTFTQAIFAVWAYQTLHGSHSTAYGRLSGRLQGCNGLKSEKHLSPRTDVIKQKRTFPPFAFLSIPTYRPYNLLLFSDYFRIHHQ